MQPKQPNLRGKQQRITVYMTPRAYARLKLLLEMEDMTVSAWFRKQAKELEERNGIE
jgi:hypothetical protein